MKKEFTPDYIRYNRGCYSINQVENLSFISKPLIHINDIINSEMPLKDKYWWVIKKCDLTLDEKKSLALKCAKIVVEIYNKKYPDDEIVSDCISAIELFNEGKIRRSELLEKRNAAYAAYAAAADAAAYAAADAAYAAAADAAAYAAAYAAYADAAYAAAAAYAAYAAYAAADAYAAYAAAADAYADAAAAAADAAYAAADAYAAYAAAADADAAYAAAAADAGYKNKLETLLKEFVSA